MFESVVEDRGSGGLRRAAKVFRVVSLMIALATALLTVTDFNAVRLIVNALLAAAAWAIAEGIDRQLRWAGWAAYIFSVLELFSFPIGTVIGIASLIYLRRASAAGLFRKENVDVRRA